MAVQVDVTTSASLLSDASAPALTYAPARPVGLSPMIEHLGPGYAVVKLVSPALIVEITRLALLALGAAVTLIMLGIVPKFLASIERAHGWGVNMLITIVVPGTALAFFVVFAFGMLRQSRVVFRRARQPARLAGSITFRRPEALTDVRDAPTALRVAVHPSPLSRLPGSRGFLRVETTDGRVMELLRGHRFAALDHLAADLRKYLLTPLPKIIKTAEVA